MAILKCKMCGGDLNVSADEKIVKCEYCGTKQTVPTSKDENLQGLFNRANILRMKSEFDKAEQIYEKIIQNDEPQAEAYWGLILCKYGIEYVEDPTTFKRIPTCHRTSFESVTADDDYKSALSYADPVQRDMYEGEAKEIDRLQKEILALSEKEEPYDVFICYKETDNDGNRTQDSVIANDIYHQLTQAGFKVFYAAITLEDKLGKQYEPYIFAALNSAKVMLVIGTKPEYFNAVWVKNEWSRYLKIIQKDRTKTLIPCYRDMDAYELPEEFAHLQAQDMSKIGFINDIVRGIKKVVGNEEETKATVYHGTAESVNGNVKALLDRGFLALEDGEWQKADDFFEQTLNFDAKLAKAYLGKLMAELKIRKVEKLALCKETFEGSNNYQKAIRFADDDLKNRLKGYVSAIEKRNEEERVSKIFASAKQKMDSAKNEEMFLSAAKEFETISGYKNAGELAKVCSEKAETIRKDNILKNAGLLLKNSSYWKETDAGIAAYERAIKQLETIKECKDAEDKIVACQNIIKEIKAEKEERRNAEERARVESARRVKEERLRAEEKEKRNKKIAMIVVISLFVAAVVFIIIKSVIIPNVKYNKATALMKEGNNDAAYEIFVDLKGYKDSDEIARSIMYNKATELMKEGNNDAAYEIFVDLKGYKDSDDIAKSIMYNKATALMKEGKNDEAYEIFVGLKGYKDSDEIAQSIMLPQIQKAQSVGDKISCGTYHTVGVRANGTVVAVGNNGKGQCDVSGWTDIVAVSARSWHTVGLKKNGTVVAVGNNEKGQCNVSGWRDIVAISAGWDYTIGLKKDGTVVAVGDNYDGQCDVSDWHDIVAVSAGSSHTVGLKKDGTVVAVGDNWREQCIVSDWHDIVAVSTGAYYTVGLKKDGTVVAVGDNRRGQCNVSGWHDIVAVSAGSGHTVGLKKDGTVVAVGDNEDGQCDVSGWTDIVAVSAGFWNTVGLKKDGTVVAVGDDDGGKCNVSGWNLF